jgi:hypothetical protein
MNMKFFGTCPDRFTDAAPPRHATRRHVSPGTGCDAQGESASNEVQGEVSRASVRCDANVSARTWKCSESWSTSEGEKSPAAPTDALMARAGRTGGHWRVLGVGVPWTITRSILSFG